MKGGLSETLLSELSHSLAEQTGLYFPRERWPDLDRGIQGAARKFGQPDAESCARWLLAAPLAQKQIEILAGELTVGETYFFREKRGFDILSERIIPEIVRRRLGAERRLRIWSAGCCTGEEPYSIAILLDRILPDFQQWHVTILATDMNPLFLRKAAEGVYSNWSFRDAPPWLKSYFRQVDKGHFEIAPRIREKVTFAYLNLAEDIYPSLTNNTNAMDLIFCRNVLMYFKAEGTKKVSRNFHRSLVDKGWLLVSPTEASSELFPQFSPVSFPDVIFYQKGGQGASPAVEPLSLEKPEEVLPPVLDFISIPISSPLAEPPAEEETKEPSLYEEAWALFGQGAYAAAAERLDGQGEVTAESAALLARIRANLGELAEARAWVEKALDLDKLNAGWHYLRATILEEQDVLEEAAAALKRALYLDPGFVLVHFALGNLALRQKNFREADKHFTNVLGLLENRPDDEVLPGSDGLATGRLREMTESALAMERAA